MLCWQTVRLGPCCRRRPRFEAAEACVRAPVITTTQNDRFEARGPRSSDLAQSSSGSDLIREPTSTSRATANANDR
jgi:hypothetical protein